jgi:hypothetical protein
MMASYCFLRAKVTVSNHALLQCLHTIGDSILTDWQRRYIPKYEILPVSFWRFPTAMRTGTVPVKLFFPLKIIKKNQKSINGNECAAQ